MVDRVVKAQLALLDELHDRDPHWRFRDRADAEERVGGDLLIRLERGGPIAARHDDAGAINDGDADAGDLFRPRRFAHRPIDERLHPRVLDLVLGLRDGVDCAERDRQGQRQQRSEQDASLQLQCKYAQRVPTLGALSCGDQPGQRQGHGVRTAENEDRLFAITAEEELLETI